jgi:hypothetical protein
MPSLTLSFHKNRYLPLDIFSSDLYLISSFPLKCTIEIHDSCGVRSSYDTTISNTPHIIRKRAYEKAIKNDYTVLEISAHIPKDASDEPYEVQIYTDHDKN